MVRPQPGHAATCGREGPQLERLQDLLADDDFFGAIAIRRGRERNTNRVADPFLQQHG